MQSNHDNLVSVVIPNFNGSDYIEECLNSVLAQSYPNIEVIVVDDGSTDDSLLILKEYSEKIRVIAQSNQGPSAARNRGILAANGDYIAFLDSDDVWDKGKIAAQMQCIFEQRSDLNYCDFIEFDSRADIGAGKSAKMSDLLGWFVSNPTSTPFLPSSVLISKQLLARTGLWSTVLQSPAEDFDLFRRCIDNGKISYLPMFLVRHRNHGRSTTAAGHYRYFNDNVQAIRMFLAEERFTMHFTKRMGIWFRLHQLHIRHAIKSKNFYMLKYVFISFTKFVI